MKEVTPPVLFLRFFRWFCHPKLHKYIEGDLIELYHAQIIKSGKRQANVRFVFDVLRLFRPEIIRPSNPYSINNYDMLKSYFKIGFRNLIRHKGYSAINIGGLALGMTIAITIALWIWDEVSYNKNFEKHDRIAQVIKNVTNNGQVDTWNFIVYPLADELRKSYGENFNRVALTTAINDCVLATETTKLIQNGIYAEPSFPEIFTLTMLKGTRDALKDQAGVLISRSTATAYFGNDDPIGKTMIIDKQMNVHVVGVYEDIPTQSSMYNLNFIASWELFYSQSGWVKNMQNPWRPNAFKLYVELTDHASFAGVSGIIKDAEIKNIDESLAKMKPEIFLHPMSDWHLRSDFKNGKNAGGRIQYIWLFGIVGVFVMFMACINFMNLSTARSERRSKEIGIRKTIGSVRSQLIYQFLSESILLSLLSLVIAIVLVVLILPGFNQIAGKQIELPWTNLMVWMMGIGFCFVIGLVAGSYPAFYLSSLKSSSAIKGIGKTGRFSSLPRKVLVVVQFTVSIVLIIGTVIVFQQIQFAKNRPVGYTRQGLVAVPTSSPAIHEHFEAIQTELMNKRVITQMAEAAAPATQSSFSTGMLDWKGKSPDLSVDFSALGISYDYGKTIGWEVLQGRDFSRDFLSDSSGFILNEAAAKYLSMTNPVGEDIYWGGNRFHIVGIVKDIITNSPYEPIKPALYFLQRGSTNYALFRINPETSASQAIAAIEEIVKKHDAENPFTYQFTDQEYAHKFGNEERVARIAGIFASIAIFISCLGIFGLSSFIAEQRSKEIGIRKVLGASLLGLWTIVSKDFFVLILISCALAVPFAYKFISEWLGGYHYHINVSGWVLAGASIGTIVITLLTVSWHTLYAASRNPVKSLRSE